MKKMILIVCILLFTVYFVFSTPVFAGFGDGFSYSNVPSTGGTSPFKTQVDNIAGSIFFILQVVSFAGILILGLKYMFSDASQKANIKNSLGMVVIGMILVFATSTVASFVVNAFEQAVS